MNYHTKIFTLLFFCVQSLLTFSALPNAGAAAAGAGDSNEQTEKNRLKAENDLLKKAITHLTNKLQRPSEPKPSLKAIEPPKTTPAVQLQPIERLHELLKAFRAAVDAKTSRSDKRNEEVVAFIREHRATINAMKSVHGETPLMLCAAYGSQFGIETLTNEMQADIFAVDNEGRSVLYYCISPDYYPTALDYFALKMQKTHQHLIEDTLAHVRSGEVVDRLWPLLTPKSKTIFAFRCQVTHPAYATIKKELLQIKKQAQDQKSIARMGAEVARAFAPTAAPALSPEQVAKLETQKAAQLRRKENKRKKAGEEKAQQALALQKKQEKEEQEKALGEKLKKEKEDEAELNAKADVFEKAHEPTHNAQAVRHAFESWKAHYAARKQQELDNQKLADEHWKTLNNKHTRKHVLAAVNVWKKLVAERNAHAHQELQLRLIACGNSLDMYHHIKNKEKKYYFSKENKELEETAMAIEFGRAQINLLLSGQRIVDFYAQRGVTPASFSNSKKPYDLAAQKLLVEIEKHIDKEYSFGPNTPMIVQLFKNCSMHKKTHEEEQAHKLFDAVRARDTKRITDLLKPSLRNSEHAHLNTFRHWLGTQSAELPADAMINGKGMRDILSMVYIELKGKPFSLIGQSKVIECMRCL